MSRQSSAIALGGGAQFAYPKTLILGPFFLQTDYRPTVRKELLEALITYGADIYRRDFAGKDTLLWTKQFGYTEEVKRWAGCRVIQLPRSSIEPRWLT